MPSNFRYVTYPDAKVFDENGNEIDHVLFGDWVRVEGAGDDGWLPVHVRGTDGWMHESDLQKERVLEIVFVDVGQGDGALVITPDDRHLVIDAGQHDHMYRFLKWRYAGFRKKWTFDAGVITHPDQDHYLGFSRLFEDPNVEFAAVYHNGLIETSSSQTPLGAMTKTGSRRYVTELMERQADLAAFLAQTSRWTTAKGGKKQYPELLESALGSVPAGGDRVRMLSTDPDHSEDGFVPGFGSGEKVRIRVLGPVTERVGTEKRLRIFGNKVGSRAFDKGKTKNGHSVLLMLEYGRVRILLGGDLNSPAESFLLEHYTGLSAPPPDANGEKRLVEAAGAVFGCDVVKSCHHGSADFLDAFLSAARPAATVVSSGDEESYAHPRSDTLGAIGLHGRGWRPLIFSTELLRSTREDEGDKRERVGRLIERIDAASGADRDALVTQRDALLDELAKRNVTVYGAINLRTDGDRIVMAYKLEKPRTGSAGSPRRKTWTEWDIYRLERNGEGPLTYRPPED